MSRRMTRRTFVQTTTAVGAALFLPRSVWGANEKLNVACVGVTGRGGEDMDGVSRRNVQFVKRESENLGLRLSVADDC